MVILVKKQKMYVGFQRILLFVYWFFIYYFLNLETSEEFLISGCEELETLAFEIDDQIVSHPINEEKEQKEGSSPSCSLPSLLDP